MKTKTMVLRHWEDVVFENRNKEYGAYALRRAYSKRVILGWGTTIAIFAALFYLPDLLVQGEVSVITPFESENTSRVLISPPPNFPPRKIESVQRMPKTKRSDNIVVTREAVETVLEPVEPVIPSSADAGTEGSFDGSVEGTSTTPVADLLYREPAEQRVHDIAEVMPRYDGGTEAMMKFIRKKIRVPASFRYLTEGGTVYIRFVVRPDGKVSDVEVIRGLSRDCDKEAMRVISMMPGWIAGMQNGTSVPVRMVLPIKFAHE